MVIKKKTRQKACFVGSEGGQGQVRWGLADNVKTFWPLSKGNLAPLKPSHGATLENNLAVP